MKKSTILILVMLLSLSVIVSGCDNKRERYEEGDFIYEIFELESGENIARIVQLSEKGKEKEVLILPKTLNGYRVNSFSYEYGLGIREKIDAKNLKRIYCPYEIYFPKLILNNVSTLEKVFVFKGDCSPRCACYSPYITTNAYDIANTLYYYNCFENEAEDCYWIDDYNYGTTITYIPPQPDREGFLFDGWYKEKECLNQWDFTTDKLPDVITKEEYLENNVSNENVVFENNNLYQQTKLYAKWKNKELK